MSLRGFLFFSIRHCKFLLMVDEGVLLLEWEVLCIGFYCWVSRFGITDNKFDLRADFVGKGFASGA